MTHNLSLKVGPIPNNNVQISQFEAVTLKIMNCSFIYDQNDSMIMDYDYDYDYNYDYDYDYDCYIGYPSELTLRLNTNDINDADQFVSVWWFWL